MDKRDSAPELHLTNGGLWAVRSTSSTVCYLDLDRMRLYRDRGRGRPEFTYDGRWVRLAQVRSPRGDSGVARVGDRHEFLTDPDGGVQDYQWWIPRVCVAIERVAESDALPRT